MKLRSKIVTSFFLISLFVSNNCFEQSAPEKYKKVIENLDYITNNSDEFYPRSVFVFGKSFVKFLQTFNNALFGTYHFSPSQTKNIVQKINKLLKASKEAASQEMLGAFNEYAQDPTLLTKDKKFQIGEELREILTKKTVQLLGNLNSYANKSVAPLTPLKPLEDVQMLFTYFEVLEVNFLELIKDNDVRAKLATCLSTISQSFLNNKNVLINSTKKSELNEYTLELQEYCYFMNSLIKEFTLLAQKFIEENNVLTPLQSTTFHRNITSIKTFIKSSTKLQEELTKAIDDLKQKNIPINSQAQTVIRKSLFQRIKDFLLRRT